MGIGKEKLKGTHAVSKKIMIVEDDMDISRNLKALLEDENYEVEVAQDGKIALEQLKELEPLPSLILLDLMMPGMDGFQFREAQERDSRIAGIPIVIMTADGHVEEKKLRVGAKAYVRKPVDIETVLEIVGAYVT